MHTDSVVQSIDDLGRRVRFRKLRGFPIPRAALFGGSCFHLVEETARHAGHADIIREALDGAQSGPLMAAVEGSPEAGWIKPWRPLS